MKPIYLYGMILATRSFLLEGSYPPADGYAEIQRKYVTVGGETAVAALILTSLGCPVTLTGTHTGTENDAIIRRYFEGKSVDLRGLHYNPDFTGVMDHVIIDKETRTCFGEFGKFYSRTAPWYTQPDEAAIAACSVVGTDPFFGDAIIPLCKKHGKKFATIDSDYDSEMVRHCDLIAISHQHLHARYPGVGFRELYARYTANSDGLVLFTAGENEVMYGRKGQEPRLCSPYPVEVVSTLGAGDSFKAGTIYALAHGMRDDEIAEFACATAGSACAHFPISLDPPTLERIAALMQTRGYTIK